MHASLSIEADVASFAKSCGETKWCSPGGLDLRLEAVDNGKRLLEVVVDRYADRMQSNSP